MADFTNYTTRQGERWDNIAFDVYDNAYLYPGILEANPEHHGKLTLEPGIVLRIPVLETQSTSLTPENLPPWRR